MKTSPTFLEFIITRDVKMLNLFEKKFISIKLIFLVLISFGVLLKPLEGYTERKKIVVPRATGKNYFLKYCGTCHKGDGRGGHTEGGGAKDLRVTLLDRDQVVYVINKGRPTLGMPAFEGVIQKERIVDIADFIKTKLAIKKEEVN